MVQSAGSPSLDRGAGPAGRTSRHRRADGRRLRRRRARHRGLHAQLADVAGRAARSELLVVRDGEGRDRRQRRAGAEPATSARSRPPTRRRRSACWWSIPAAQGRGIGELLVTTCLDRARAAGKRRMVISTDPRMTAAHRLYERLGFRRLPERDWTPDAAASTCWSTRGTCEGQPATTVAMRSPSWSTSPSTTCRSCTVPALLGQHRDLHLHRLEDHQRVPGRDLRRPARRGPSRRWRPSPRGSPRPPPGLLCAAPPPLGRDHPSTAVRPSRDACSRRPAGRAPRSTSAPSCGTPTSGRSGERVGSGPRRGRGVRAGRR